MSILKATPEQITLAEDGQILFQEKPGSPLPGAPVGKLVKGDEPLKPIITLHDDQEIEVLEHLQVWFTAYMGKVLEPLVELEALEGLDEPENSIIRKTYDAMGVLPREELLGLIQDLDADKRRVIRSAGIKLGPILVFMPRLNKPAAVRLKALLWSLYNDKPLPAAVPADGIVSQVVKDLEIDLDMYRQIGYPVYGPRACRIDMLDRVISSIYEAADKGKFQAQHQMAEWLGANLDDLYAILEAMGHKRIVSEAPVESEASAESDKPAETEAPAKPAAEEGVEKAEDTTAEPKDPAVKPELDWFFLKRGAAHSKGAAGAKPKAQGKQAGKDRSHKQKEKANRAKKNVGRKKETMFSGPAPNPEDSPFAVLAQLKK